MKNKTKIMMALAAVFMMIAVTGAVMTSDNSDAETSTGNACKIGSAEYGTIYNALDAATAGDTIVLLKNISVTEIIKISKSLTINGNGHTITTTASRGICIVENNISLTLSGLILNGNNKCDRGLQINTLTGEINKATVSISGCTIKNVTHYAINCTLNTEVDFTIKDSTISGWAALNVWSQGFTFKIDDCTLEGINNYSGPSNNFGVVVLEGDTTGKTENASFNNEITINNSKIIASQTGGREQSPILFNIYSRNNSVTVTGGEISWPGDSSVLTDNGNDNKISMTAVKFNVTDSCQALKLFDILASKSIKDNTIVLSDKVNVNFDTDFSNYNDVINNGCITVADNANMINYRTVTNEGTITNNGTITVNGVLINEGTINSNNADFTISAGGEMLDTGSINPDSYSDNRKITVNGKYVGKNNSQTDGSGTVVESVDISNENPVISKPDSTEAAIKITGAPTKPVEISLADGMKVVIDNSGIEKALNLVVEMKKSDTVSSVGGNVFKVDTVGVPLNTKLTFTLPASGTDSKVYYIDNGVAEDYSDKIVSRTSVAVTFTVNHNSEYAVVSSAEEPVVKYHDVKLSAGLGTSISCSEGYSFRMSGNQTVDFKVFVFEGYLMSGNITSDNAKITNLGNGSYRISNVTGDVNIHVSAFENTQPSEDKENGNNGMTLAVAIAACAAVALTVVGLVAYTRKQ